MSDLVERLRGQTDILDAAGYEVLCREAADEIERLRAKIASLKIQKQEVHEIGWELAKERDSLRAELAACREDAERFRAWVANPYALFRTAWRVWDGHSDWRVAIDAAREGK